MKNDLAEFLALVSCGAVNSVLYGPDGRELIVYSLGPGALVGEGALLQLGGMARRSATAVACGKTEIHMLDKRHFGALLALDGCRDQLLRWCGWQHQQTMQLLESIGLLRLETRLARLLLRLSGDDAQCAIRLPRNQSNLAAMINGSRPKVNFLLSDWTARGVLRKDRRSFFVADLPALRRLAVPSA